MESLDHESASNHPGQLKPQRPSNDSQPRSVLQRTKSLQFFIHDLNPWGGHDRSTLEVAWRLSHEVEVTVHCYRFEGKGKDWKNLRIRQVQPDPRKPAWLRFTWFQLVTGWRYWRSRGQHKDVHKDGLFHSTGTASLVSQVVQVQFVNTSWRKIQRQLGPEVYSPPFSRSGGFKAQLVQIYHRLLMSWNCWLERKFYTSKRHYIAIAECVAQELRENFGADLPISVVRHGVDVQEFRPAKAEDHEVLLCLRDSLRIEESDHVVLFVGAYERKGLSVAIQALAKLPQEVRSRTILVAVGSGATQAFERLATQEGVAERVRLVPHNKEIPDYYRMANSFLLPTFYEPFGLVILEALASGLPSIVSRCAGGAELIEDGKSGLLINQPQDREEVARLLEKLLGSRQLRETLATEGRKVAEGRDWNRVSQEYIRVLRGVE